MRLLPLFFLSFFIFACQPAQKQAEPSSELGKISFEVEGSTEAMPHFERGVAALHNFWYPEALEAFQKAREIDPDFVMAHWGEAMSHNRTFWQVQDREAALAVLQELGTTSEERLKLASSDKERLFLESLDMLYNASDDKLARDRAYMRFMRSFHEKYPDDQEVASFYALSLLGILRNNQGNEKERMEAAAVAQKVIAQNSEHPGAVHYLIHAMDDPLHAPLALDAARTYARIAPESNHALHMPSHIFVQLGLWDEVVSSNTDAFAASQKWVARKDLDISEWDYHSLAWMSYGYEQGGQFSKSADNLQLIKTSAAETGGGGSIDYYLPIMQGNYILNSQKWEVLPAPEWQDKKGRSLYAQVSYLLASGLSAVHLEDFESAENVLALMQQIRENFNSKEVDKPYYRQLIRINESALGGFLHFARGDAESARQLFETGTSLEESMNPPTGPPDVIKPIHELYGEVLLEMGEARQAMEAFAISLERTPGRSASLLGMARAAEMADDRPTAYQYYQDFLNNWENADADQAEVPEAEQYLALNPGQEGKATAYLPTPLQVSSLDERLSISQCLPTGM
jgi:tetratricopeptide (TPR) repeat protein